MSPFITNIVVPVSDSIKNLFTVIYITKTLFDCDSTNIEYAYENPRDLTKPFRVFRTDGTLLFQEDSTNGPYFFGVYGGSIDIRPVLQTSDGAKLFLQKPYNGQGVPVRIYALCGELPTTIYDFSTPKNFVRISPNPANMKLTFEIIPPNNMDEFQLVIFDSNAQEQRRESISLLQRNFSIDVGDFSSGTYFFSLVSNRKEYQSGKFVVAK